MVWLYVLEDPRDDSINYVGITKQPRVRMQQHLLNHEDWYIARWVQKLIREGVLPRMVLLFETENWQEDEKRYIALYKAAGHPLKNLTEGGQGYDMLSAPFREKHLATQRTPEIREKRRKDRARLNKDPIIREKVSEGRSKWCEEHPEWTKRFVSGGHKRLTELRKDPEWEARRAANQSASVKAYWTPERRAEWSEKMRKLRADKRVANSMK